MVDAGFIIFFITIAQKIICSTQLMRKTIPYVCRNKYRQLSVLRKIILNLVLYTSPIKLFLLNRSYKMPYNFFQFTKSQIQNFTVNTYAIHLQLSVLNEYFLVCFVSENFKKHTVTIAPLFSVIETILWMKPYSSICFNR